MEKNKIISFLFLLFAVPHVCGVSGCPTNNKVFLTDLTCYNDYNNTITCQWKSPYIPDHIEPNCTISAKNERMSGSCKLKPVDISNPVLKECSIVFEYDWRFQSFTELTMDLRCEPLMQHLSFVYKPACNIKLNPPPQPRINFTSISWNSQVAKLRFNYYRSELQWKREDQSWNDTDVVKKFAECHWDCTAELNKDLLVEGMRHEARVRVEKVDEDRYLSTWSNWSPTVSWVSPIGRAEPTPTPTPPSSGVPGGIVSWVSVACGAVVAVAVIFLKTNNTTWIYIVKRIRSSPLPDPGKSFLQDGNFQNWLSPHFTIQPCPSKPVEFSSVEISSAVDAVAPSGPEASHLVKSGGQNSCESTSSSFSNPSYSQVSPPPPVSSLTAGNLEACDADSPYGPVGSQSDGKNAEQDRDEVREKEVEIQQLLSKGSNNSEPVLVISDYEKVEKPQVERSRLQSLDSGVCSEEVSQESFEADSINVNDYHDEGPEGKEDREEKVADFQKLFGGSGGHSDTAAILVCSDYESVRKLQADSPELPSLDSGITSEGEEQLSQEESLEDVDKSTESTSLLFSSLHPAPTSTLACSSPLFTPFPLKVSAAGLNPALLEKFALMPNSRSVEPSGDGYMPVRQEQN